MPPLDIENPGVPAVVRVGKILEHLLSEAASSKQTSAIEPAANPPDFEDLTARIAAALKDDVSPSVKDDNGVPQETDKLRQFAVLETAARDIFDELIVLTTPPLHCVWLQLLTLCLSGFYEHRLSRIPPDVEFARHSLDVVRPRPVRPGTDVLAGGRAAG